MAGFHGSAGPQRLPLTLIMRFRCPYLLGLQVTGGHRWPQVASGPGQKGGVIDRAGRAEDPAKAEGTQWLTPGGMSQRRTGGLQYLPDRRG